MPEIQVELQKEEINEIEKKRDTIPLHSQQTRSMHINASLQLLSYPQAEQTPLEATWHPLFVCWKNQTPATMWQSSDLEISPRAIFGQVSGEPIKELAGRPFNGEHSWSPNRPRKVAYSRTPTP